jgi:hypothetical protein
VKRTGDQYTYIDGNKRIFKPIWEDENGKKFIKTGGKLVEVIKVSSGSMVYYTIKQA